MNSSNIFKVLTYKYCKEKSFQCGIDWTGEKIDSSATICKDIYYNILSSLTNEINIYSGRSWSTKQYEILLGNWLMDFVHSSYARWLEIEYFTNEELQGIHINKQYFQPAINLTEALSRAPENEEFQNNLFCQLVELKLFGSFQEIIPGNSSRINQKYLRSPNQKIKALFYRFLSIFTDKKYLNKILMVQPCFKIESKCMEILTLFKFSRFCKFDDFNVEYEIDCLIDYNWRLEHLKFDKLKGCSFADIINALVRLHLPIVFLEAYPNIKKLLEVKYSEEPETLYTGMAHMSNTLFKTYAASKIDTKSLIIHQHGAGGTFKKVNPSYDYEASIADHYFVLGEYLPTANSRYVSGAFCELNNNLQHETRTGVLLTLLGMPKYVFRFSMNPMCSRHAKQIDDTIRFIKLLDFSHDLYVRIPGFDYGWKVSDVFSRNNLRFSESSSKNKFRAEAVKYRLNVFNYLGTTWLESLVLNTPTVVFYDNDVYSVNTEFEHILSELKAVGILHTSPESAVKHVSEVYKDIHLWWKNSQVQQARIEFIRIFGKHSPDWIPNLKHELLTS